MVFTIDSQTYIVTGEYTIAELAENFDASAAAVRAAIMDGILPHIRAPSGELLIPKDFVERWLFCSQQNTRRSGNEGND